MMPRDGPSLPKLFRFHAVLQDLPNQILGIAMTDLDDLGPIWKVYSLVSIGIGTTS